MSIPILYGVYHRRFFFPRIWFLSYAENRKIGGIRQHWLFMALLFCGWADIEIKNVIYRNK